MPSVEYEVTLTDGAMLPVHSPNDFPDPTKVAEVREPYIRASILTPKEFIGQIMELCQERRGDHSGMHYLSSERVQLTYDLPLAEIVLDFFDQLKSRTRGYASLDYELIGLRESDLVKLDILLAGDPVDALSMLVHRSKALRRGPDAGRDSCARRSRASSTTSRSRRRSGRGSSLARRSRPTART